MESRARLSPSGHACLEESFLKNELSPPPPPPSPHPHALSSLSPLLLSTRSTCQVGVYMPLYDYMLAALEENGRARGHAATTTTNAAQAALAGGAARAVAVLATSPLELARTRAQGLVGNGVCAAGAATPPRPPAPALPKPQGLGALAATRAAWTGAGATLARDVPFSALYWAALEPARRAVLGGMGYSAGGDGGGSTGGSPSLPPPSPGAAAVANLFAGAAAGGAAAAATTPLDVAKTAVQLADAQCAACGGTTSAAAAADARARGVVATLRALHSAGGLPALFAGVGPRAARAAPACAIVVVAYELLKMAAMPGGGHGMHGMHEAADRAARVALAAVEE